MSVVQFSDVLADRLEELRQHQLDRAAGLRDTGFTTPLIPVVNELEVDTLDPSIIDVAFSRDSINVEYTESLLEDGTVADCMAAKIQGDTLSMLERSFRLRHAGPIRRRLWAASRATGHGHPLGIWSRLESWIQSLLVEADNGIPPSEDATSLDELAASENAEVNRP